MYPLSTTPLSTMSSKFSEVYAVHSASFCTVRNWPSGCCPLVTFNRENNVVEPKLRSVAILSAVREREAAYVWAAQVGAARRAGLREEVIDLIRAKGDPAALSDEERDTVTYVRQLMRTNRVDQAVFDRLKSRHDAQWMVELTEVANYFAFLSGMVNPFEVPAPPDGDKLPR